MFGWVCVFVWVWVWLHVWERGGTPLQVSRVLSPAVSHPFKFTVVTCGHYWWRVVTADGTTAAAQCKSVPSSCLTKPSIPHSLRKKEKTSREPRRDVALAVGRFMTFQFFGFLLCSWLNQSKKKKKKKKKNKSAITLTCCSCGEQWGLSISTFSFPGSRAIVLADYLPCQFQFLIRHTFFYESNFFTFELFFCLFVFLNHSPKKVAFVFVHLRDNDLAANQSGPSGSLVWTFYCHLMCKIRILL